MQKVFTAQTLLAVAHIKNLLEAADIPVELRNEYAAGASGELAFTDTWPELWVSYDDVALAKRIIGDSQQISGDDWVCACGESNGPAFASCWSCNSEKV